MHLSSMYNHFHVTYTRSLAFSGQSKLFCNQNDFWCCILWLLEYIMFFHRRSCQPRVHRLVVVHYVADEQNGVDQCSVVGGQSSSHWTPRLVILQRRWRRCRWSANTLAIALVVTLVIDVIKELLILILTKIIHVFLKKSYNGMLVSDGMFILVWCLCL